MKYLIAVLLTSALTVSVQAAPPAKSQKTTQAVEADPVTDFKALVATASQQKTWTRPYKNSQQKWVRHNVSRGEVRYDVKKTDSLMNPMVGVVSFPVSASTTPPYDAETEALDSTASPIMTISYDIDINYHFANGKWVMQEIRYKNTSPGNPLKGTELTMDREKLEKNRDSTIALALLPWATGSQ